VGVDKKKIEGRTAENARSPETIRSPDAAQPRDAERVLWRRLRHDITLAGSHFRRQALIGPFIVDFVSCKARLVIELDGGQHDEQQEADARRTRQIEATGYRVLRFWNNDVLSNICAHPHPLPARGRGAAATLIQNRGYACTTVLLRRRPYRIDGSRYGFSRVLSLATTCG